jgi:hypothetical protein
MFAGFQVGIEGDDLAPGFGDKADKVSLFNIISRLVMLLQRFFWFSGNCRGDLPDLGDAVIYRRLERTSWDNDLTAGQWVWLESTRSKLYLSDIFPSQPLKIP